MAISPLTLEQIATMTENEQLAYNAWLDGINSRVKARHLPNVIATDTRDVKTLTDAEITEHRNFFVKGKMWNSRYFALDHENQSRKVWSWVKEDVFGPK